MEFDVEGDSDLIAREREQFWKNLLADFLSVPEIQEQENAEVPANVMLRQGSQENNGIIARGDNKEESLSEFLQKKQFSKIVDFIMGVAYYLTCIKGMDTFTAADINRAIETAQWPKPRNVWSGIHGNMKCGRIQAASNLKDGRQSYKILEAGRKWCEHYVPESKGNREKQAETIQSGCALERLSALRNISLADLPWEKSCDPLKADKFGEQLLMVMYICQNEKNIESFSAMDIIAIFKQIFQMEVSPRRIHYAAKHGEPAFDKDIKKRVIYYRLTDEGKTEAERLIAKYKKRKGKRNNKFLVRPNKSK